MIYDAWLAWPLFVVIEKRRESMIRTITMHFITMANEINGLPIENERLYFVMIQTDTVAFTHPGEAAQFLVFDRNFRSIHTPGHIAKYIATEFSSTSTILPVHSYSPAQDCNCFVFHSKQYVDFPLLDRICLVGTCRSRPPHSRLQTVRLLWSGQNFGVYTVSFKT